MGHFIDETGNTYGSLMVLSKAKPNGKSTRAFWDCRCVCGVVTKVVGQDLRSGNTSSCGCRMNVSHGQSRSPTYQIWEQMKQRCCNPRTKGYENYGGRGITVCDEWQKFPQFLADMGMKPKGLSIDRVDNNGNYEPSNCRWATRTEQSQNSRACRLNSEAVKVIRYLHKYSGVSKNRLTKAYNVNISTINNVISNRTWKNVGLPEWINP